MKILYVTPAFHHPDVRGPTRCYHFTRELARNHRITLLSPTSVEIPHAAREEVRAWVDHLEIFEARSTPTTRALALIPGVGRRIAAAIRHRGAVRRMTDAFRKSVAEDRPDVVLFHGKNVLPVIDGCSLPIVVDFCDATSMRVRSRMRFAGLGNRILLALRYLQVRRIEKKLLAASRHVAFVSCRDREAIVGVDSDTRVVTIGVDTEFWRSDSRSFDEAPSIVFAGIMSYSPNEDAALVLIDEVLPRVRRSVPDVRVVIVGRDPSRELRARGEQDPGVEITGFVDDVRPYLAGASLSAVPMRYGSGVQNKALEAMAMELPVVTTSIVAAGLRVEDEEEPPVLVADSPNEIADQIVNLLGDAKERRAVGLAGRRFVERTFDWSRSAKTLEEMCAAAALEPETR